MQATQILEQEHRVIEQVLSCLEKISDQALQTKVLDRKSAEEALDFFRHFADHCHHGKEEGQLFPLLEANGFPREGGPTGVMLYEHEEGRKHIQAMTAVLDPAQKGEREAIERFAQHARSYVNLLREHIHKEDHCLFPMANRALSDREQEELLRQFDTVEHEEIGAGVHEQYLLLANDLANRFQVPNVVELENGTHGCCSHGHQKSGIDKGLPS